MIERFDFLFLLPFILDLIGGLNVIAFAAQVCNKVDFQLFTLKLPFRVFFSDLYDADINQITAASKFHIDDIFHQMGGFILSEGQPGISQTGIFKVDLIGRIDIFFAFHIVPFDDIDQESLLQESHVLTDSRCADFHLLFTAESIFEDVRIDERRHA